jgi:hypothetical protein
MSKKGTDGNYKNNASKVFVYIDDYSKKGKKTTGKEKILNQTKNYLLKEKIEVSALGTRRVLTVESKNNKFNLPSTIITKIIKGLNNETKKTTNDFKMFTRLSLPTRYYTFNVDNDTGDMEGYAENGNPSIE